jgi:hypothetical protein
VFCTIGLQSPNQVIQEKQSLPSYEVNVGAVCDVRITSVSGCREAGMVLGLDSTLVQQSLPGRAGVPTYCHISGAAFVYDNNTNDERSIDGNSKSVCLAPYQENSVSEGACIADAEGCVSSPVSWNSGAGQFCIVNVFGALDFTDSTLFASDILQLNGELYADGAVPQGLKAMTQLLWGNSSESSPASAPWKVCAGPRGLPHTLPASSTQGLVQEIFHNYFRGSISVNGYPVPDHITTVAAINYTRASSPWSGFPSNYFAVRWTGFFFVSFLGLHSFGLQSDDGSKLWLSDSVTVDNDGCHASRLQVSRVMLHAGLVPLRLEFFDDNLEHEMVFMFAGPEHEKLRGELTTVPPSKFRCDGYCLTSPILQTAQHVKDLLAKSAELLLEI